MGPGERVWPTAPVMSQSSKWSGKKMGLTRVIANPNCHFPCTVGGGGRGKLQDTTLPNLADNVTLLQYMACRPSIPGEPTHTQGATPYQAITREIPRTLLTPFNPTA